MRGRRSRPNRQPSPARVPQAVPGRPLPVAGEVTSRTSLLRHAGEVTSRTSLLPHAGEVTSRTSLLPHAGEGGRRPDEGASLPAKPSALTRPGPASGPRSTSPGRGRGDTTTSLLRHAGEAASRTSLLRHAGEVTSRTSLLPAREKVAEGRMRGRRRPEVTSPARNVADKRPSSARENRPRNTRGSNPTCG